MCRFSGILPGPVVALILFILCPLVSQAHVGSPDVFFEGLAGSYPVRVNVRMPGVVPGRAQINVEVINGAPVEVSFRPLFFATQVSNTPPAEKGVLLAGTTNWYQGELWLMANGAYTIEVNLNGPSGKSSLQIPVDSVATRQMGMPPYLGALLAVLGLGLVLSGVAIVVGATREAVLAADETMSAAHRRKGWIAGTVTTIIFTGALWFGSHWWRAEEKDFRTQLRTGGWPPIEVSLRSADDGRWLDIFIPKKKMMGGDDEDDTLKLTPDHGKLAHLFLVGEPGHDTFAHLHPVRTSGRTFSAALPPLAQGNYAVFCDFTLEQNGFGYTAIDHVSIPTGASTHNAALDADDSWAVGDPSKNGAGKDVASVYRFPDGSSITWMLHPPLVAGGDASLRFNVWDAAGKPAVLEPYMEMQAHGVIMRADEKVFVHLHPMGNYSMASQRFFQNKLAREKGDASAALCGVPNDHSKDAQGNPITTTLISFPYEFPSAGTYRVWVQFKSAGKVYTAVFDATVVGRPAA